MMLSIDALLKQAIEPLITMGSSSPQLDAEVLLCHALNKPRSYLFTWPEKSVEEKVIHHFNELLERRLSGEPIAYIVGYREFWSLKLKVSPTTLIPRPDTECLVETALTYLSTHSSSILDLGTGTGAIALALASEVPTIQVLGVDAQREAVELAEHNAKANQIHNAQFLQGSWFEPINDNDVFSMIVSNPPYIDEQDPHLMQGDVRFEPKSALVAQEKGLADLRHIIENSRHYLADKGWLLLEHGYQQGETLRDYFIKYGYVNVKTEQDYAGHDRITIGQWSLESTNPENIQG